MERWTLEEAICRVRGVAKKQRWNSKYTKVSLMNEELNKQHKADCVKDAEEHEQLAEWLEKLKSYEDLEEQGLLVRLPANNKEIYIISSRWTVCSECGSRFDEYSCSGCEYECDSKKEYYVYSIYLSSITVGTYVDRFGKTVFLTREEAEKKLKELKNEI